MDLTDIGTRSEKFRIMSIVPDDNLLPRRNLLKGAAAAGLASLLKPLPQVEATTPRQPDLIRTENDKPGTTGWQLETVRIDPQTRYRSSGIEGYCSRTSLRAGETLQILVSTNPASPFVIDVFRLGYYGGKGGRHVRPLSPAAYSLIRTLVWSDSGNAAGNRRSSSLFRRTGRVGCTSES